MNFSCRIFPKTSPLKGTTSGNKDVNVPYFASFNYFTGLEFGLLGGMYGDRDDKNIVFPSSAYISSTSSSISLTGLGFC